LSAGSIRVSIQPVSASQARPLREVVLRPGYPPEKSIYPQDRLPQVLHAGALMEGELVGVATVFPEPPPWELVPGAWRLRGMAVLAPARGLGIGKQLVQFCLEHIQSQGGRLLWCNARVSALPFYQGLGFQTIGAQFLSPESGPHVQMFRTISG
jgi:GNAT superfamily N-acetyltransferase